MDLAGDDSAAAPGMAPSMAPDIAPSVASGKAPRLVEVRANILKENDQRARALRARFAAAGTRVVSLVSSPGAGKTALLERLLAAARAKFRVAALVGDLATENDSRRLARSGAPARQINTGSLCHLDAGMIERALEDWANEGVAALAPGALDLLFIENVGNLVCPASYDLGENLRLVLLAATEGEDKPLKYPTIFHTADLAVLTKCDLATAVEFRREAALANIAAVRPGMEVVETSAKTGQGVAALLRICAGERPEAAA